MACLLSPLYEMKTDFEYRMQGAEFRSLGPEASFRVEKNFLEDNMFQL